MSRYFVDIAAVRIQTWLARSRTLKGRRGASAALSRSTEWANVQPWLSDLDVQRNAEAGDVDGVINLELLHPADESQVMARCFRQLRGQLPALEFAAVAGAGEDYLDAYARQIKPKITASRVASSVPALADFPPISTCEQCRVDAASATVRLPDGEQVRVCADCATRHDEAGGAQGRAEEMLRARLERPAVGFARAFDELAEVPVVVDDSAGVPVVGSRRRKQERNHLAAIFIDGNSVGALLDAVADQHGGGPAGAKAELARRITESTSEALVAATRAITPADAGTVPLSLHLLGGDDLLVSVPATAAFRFARTFLAIYGSRLAGIAAEFPAVTPPSASAGVVIAHATAPFADAVTLAEALLTEAKRAVRGRAASLAWLDVTVDGVRPLPDRPVLRLDDLTDGAELHLALRQLGAVSQSQRSTLAELAQRRTTDTDGDVEKILRAQAKRLDMAEQVEPFLGGRSKLGLPDALRLVRWYR